MKHLRRTLQILVLTAVMAVSAKASYILLPMDYETQRDHLKAYGITYWVIDSGEEAYWLLNYKGGSFAFQHNDIFERECKVRGVTYKVISNAQFAQIRSEIADPEVNQEVIKLEQAPKIAVYTPDFNAKGKKVQPWDDAVTLVLTYAEIPYETVYDRDVLEDKLAEYDWLHLHHEDFTGQYGKFFASQGSTAWYKANQAKMESLAGELGFTMLCQNHTLTVKGFMGQSTAFKKRTVKTEILVMGENKASDEVRYIHGQHGYGTWTFYGGHDPEDYRHYVNDPETDLSLHPNSPGYRLILNNILFPAAEKKKRKT